MRYVPFGRTGLQVSQLCLGTMTFGFQCDEQQSFAILDAAHDAGVDFLDTADVYPLGGGTERAGVTEEILGRWLKGRRDEFILATKCAGVMGPKPWQRGGSRKHVLDAIDASRHVADHWCEPAGTAPRERRGDRDGPRSGVAGAAGCTHGAVPVR